MENNSNLLALTMEMIQNFLRVIPNIMGAILIALIGYMISKQAAKIFKKFLRKTPLDEFGENINDIDIIQRTNLKITPSKVLSKILYYVLMMFFLIAAADVLKMDSVSQLITDLINFIPQLLAAFAILLIGIFLSDAIRKLVLTTCKSLNIPAAKIIATFVFYFLFINILIAALDQAGIEITALSQNISILLAGLVLAFGIGYGIASREIFANILASYYYQSKLQVGQKIGFEERIGIIEDITRNHIVLRTEENVTIHIPMHKISKEDIIFYHNK